MKKKVAIITKYSSHNFGAMLQAYALQQTIMSMNVECIIVDYDRKSPLKKVSWRSVSGILNNIYGNIYKKELNQAFEKFENFINEKFVTSMRYEDYGRLEKSSPKADVYITGSDQVWNPLKIEDSYFLRFVPEDTIRASYAASMGISYIPEGSKRLLKEYLEDIDYISVREHSAQELIKENMNMDAKVHIDPVLLLEKEQWKKLMVLPRKRKPYILCYILYRPKWLNDWIKKLHQATGLEIVAVTSDAYRNIYHNSMVRDAGPLEMLGLIHDAEFVVSSSFHGVALSIVMEKPFYAVVNPDAPSRIENLLKTVGLEERIIRQGSKTNILGIQYENAKNIIQKEKGRSIDYLSDIIFNGHKKEEKIFEKTNQIYNSNISEVGNKCTGCKTCIEICPADAIDFKCNEEGFFYPYIDEKRCIHCGKCLKSCHVIDLKDKNSKESAVAFYGWHKDENIRYTSSSGGVFSALSKWVEEQDGLVIGAYFDETRRVLHGASDLIDSQKFRRSKYVESDLADTHNLIAKGLKENRFVLFCGTPCQCAGIKKHFNNEEKLILCDFFCHGVPSRKVFSDYLKYKESRSKSVLRECSFRTKYYGWSQYGMDIKYDDYTEHSVGRCEWFFVATMIDNLFLRKSCYTCDKSMYHKADFTIGDFWGISSYKPEINDNKGISLILANNEKALKIIQDIQNDVSIYPLEKKWLDYAFRIKTNDKLLEKRNRLFKEYLNVGYERFVDKYYKRKIAISKSVFISKKNKLKHEKRD